MTEQEKKKPRRMRGEGSVYQRADGLWVGQVDLGWTYDSAKGKRVRKRKTIYGKTQKAALDKLKAAKRAVDDGVRTTKSSTLEKWLDYWLDEICPTKTNRSGALLKPKTLSNYRSYVNAYLKPSIGRVKLDRLEAQHVRQLHRFAAADGRSSTTAMHAHVILGTALNDAMREGLLQRNVVSLVATPAKADGGQRALTLPEVARFLHKVKEDRLAARWHFGFLEGTRQGETLGVRWSALNLDRGVVDIAWQLQRIPYRHGCGKKGDAWSCGRRGADRCPSRELAVQPGFFYEQLDGNLCLQRPKTSGSTRLLPLPDVLVRSLRERHELYLAERQHYVVDHGLAFCRLDGRPLDASIDREQWHEHLAAANVADADQHAMRHTTSTLLLELGVSERERMAILGHSEAATNRLYTHVDLSLQLQAMQKLGGALEQTLAKALEA